MNLDIILDIIPDIVIMLCPTCGMRWRRRSRHSRLDLVLATSRVVHDARATLSRRTPARATHFALRLASLATARTSRAMTDTWHLSAVASLVENLDKRLLVALRDGSNIIGTLRSFDQFANIVLESAVERIIVGKMFSDIPLGLYIVRGENVVLMGDVGANGDLDGTEGLIEVDNAEIIRAREADQTAEAMKGDILKRMDFLDE